MIAYAAIDLRGGRVVQLVGGRPEEERVSLVDPVAVAQSWIEHGFTALHVIDLDAALGTGSNREAIEAIIAAVNVPVQVGGGVRDDDSAAVLLDAGAARVIAGTRAIEDPAWLADLSLRHSGRVIVAADVRGENVVTRGWTEEAGLEPRALLERLGDLPLAGVLVTDVGREGQMLGADDDRFAALAATTRHPLIAAGGIANNADVRRLAERGVAGVVLGMALYTGAIDARAIAREYGL